MADTFGFDIAMKYLEHGKKIKRLSNSSPKDYLYMHQLGVIMSHEEYDPNDPDDRESEPTNHRISFDKEELSATDWVLFE